MTAIRWGVLVLLLALFGAGQNTAVPADQEPHHHVLLKNDSITLMRVTLAPGETTQFHVHSRDIAGVDLVSSTTTEQPLGGQEGPPSTSRAGEVWAEPRSNRPVTHRVHNVGAGPMDLIAVEFLKGPSGQTSTPAASVAAENPSVRIYNWVLAPGAVSPMHTHERPYLIVAGKQMKLKMSAPDGRSLSEEVKPADVHWIEAKVTHSLANEGTSEGQIIEFELK